MSKVTIREFFEEDAISYVDWQTDPSVSEYVEWLPRSEAGALDDFQSALQDRDRDFRKNYFFAIVLPEESDVIGSVGITLDDDASGEVGWFLRKKYWGFGYGKEAARLMLDYAFTELGLEKIIATCHPENIASQKVMSHCGLKMIKQGGKQLAFQISRTHWKKNKV